MKQNYLTENVINMNYDPNDFANFMEYKMGKFPSPFPQNYYKTLYRSDNNSCILCF